MQPHWYFISVNSIAPAGGVDLQIGPGPGDVIHVEGGKVIRIRP